MDAPAERAYTYSVHVAFSALDLVRTQKNSILYIFVELSSQSRSSGSNKKRIELNYEIVNNMTQTMSGMQGKRTHMKIDIFNYQPYIRTYTHQFIAWLRFCAHLHPVQPFFDNRVTKTYFLLARRSEGKKLHISKRPISVFTNSIVCG